MRLTGRPRTPLEILACADVLAPSTEPPFFDARGDCTPTVTPPNHTIALTSRPVPSPAMHLNPVHHCYTHD